MLPFAAGLELLAKHKKNIYINKKSHIAKLYKDLITNWRFQVT